GALQSLEKDVKFFLTFFPIAILDYYVGSVQTMFEGVVSNPCFSNVSLGSGRMLRVLAIGLLLPLRSSRGRGLIDARWFSIRSSLLCLGLRGGRRRLLVSFVPGLVHAETPDARSQVLACAVLPPSAPNLPRWTPGAVSPFTAR